MEKIYISLFCVTISMFSFSQEEAESCAKPSKKVMKLINAGINAKDTRTAVESFNAAIKLDEENATAYYEYGMYAYNQGLKNYDTYPNPARGDRSFLKAEEMLSIALDLCSDFHANCSYYLGVINYTQQDKRTAIKWFKEFKKFKHSDTDRYPEDFTKKLNDVNEVLADLERDQKVKENVVPFKPQIVKNVSTSNNEYFPMLSPDNELIFYTRKLDRKNLGDMRSKVVEEITFSKRKSVLQNFDNGAPLANPFNDGSFQSYGAATLSVDNKEMIVCACKKEEVYGQPYMNCDLYITTYQRSGAGGNDFSWTPLENMGDKINTPDGWEAQPSLSADGKTLYYTVNRPTSQNNDIYVAERQEDGSWISRPFGEINTAGKDKSPFLHQDSETLYFVSESTKERPGVGGLDIFYIREENGVWSKPKNIGYPINSPEDELGLFVSIDGQVAYFSSRIGGKWNIYSFDLYEEARPQSVAILKGELKDENGEAVEDATIEITYEGSDEVTEVKVNGDDGKYAAIIKTDIKQDIMVTVKKEGHAFDSKLITKEEIAKVIDKPAVENKQKPVKIGGNDLAVKELKVGEAYTINDILFGTNSYELNKKSKFILRGFARFLKENGSIEVTIQGHTDDIGDDEKNMLLSEQRAQEVKKYLVSLGIIEGRLSAKGFGETQAKFPNSNVINRAKNRRTDFVIEGM
ncbi:MAG TPA: hypothetical protein EYG86_08160 [Crocinitomicaceae bacterium]|nr:hypothetical protein [Crocinitomicaceae bacterium]